MTGWWEHAIALPAAMGVFGAALYVWRTHHLLGRGRRELEVQRQEHLSLFDHNVDAVVAVDPGGEIRRANAATAELLGRPVERLIGQPFRDLISPGDRLKSDSALRSALDGTESTRSTHVLRRDGDLIDVELTSVPIRVDGEVVGAFEILRDTSERRQLERELESRALHDYLTGLPNRALFSDRLNHALQRGRRDGGQVALLYVDLDRFKPVNDRAGHQVGDELLREVARRLENVVRDADTVARLGGDEFAVLLETVDGEEHALSAAERIVSLVRTPVTVDDEEHQVGASVGIALTGTERPDAEELVRQADRAMYEAKRRGGFQFRLYSHDLAEDSSARTAQLEAELRRAVERAELRLEYQPIVDMSGSTVVGVEALVRWPHAELGRLLPSSFISIAERSSLIAELDRWVLERSCRDVRRLVDFGVIEPPFCLSVNLSARHFLEPDFIEAISDILRETGFDPELLQLEITESSAGGDREKVRALKTLGVRVAIDDFGTGFSSLGYLRDLDVDVLKVDKSFVLALGADPASVAIVRTILTLAEMLDLEVIVEGIEDPLQLGHLKDLGETLMQGYLFGRPVPASDLGGLISRGVSPDPERSEGKAAKARTPRLETPSPASLVPQPRGRWK